jgi:hypothetical protein
MGRIWMLVVSLAVLLAAVFLDLPSQAFAARDAATDAVITVTTTSPEVVEDGECSLIEAMENANAQGLAVPHPDCEPGSEGENVIVLATDAIYTLTTAHNETNGFNGLPSITSEITIQGNGAVIERSDADGTPEFRLFRIEPTRALTINDLTVRNGLLTGTFGGGGIRNEAGRLALNRSTVRDNQSNGAAGIFNFGGQATINDSEISFNLNTSTGTFGAGLVNQPSSALLQDATTVLNNSIVTGNSSVSGGGGISINGINNLTSSVTLNNSLVDANTAALTGGGIATSVPTGAVNQTVVLVLQGSTVSNNQSTDGNGGGISTGASGATNVANVLINNSTLSGNSATSNRVGNGNGGGLANFAGANVTLSNSTVVANSANGNGFNAGNAGGIFHQGGTLQVVNSTISGNAANGLSETGGAGGGVITAGFNAPASVTFLNSTIANNQARTAGGGVGTVVLAAPASTTFKNTIVAGNVAPADRNCANQGGTVTSQGHNLEDLDTCPFTAPGDKRKVEPLLAPLANNGGPTETHALLPGSPAIDAGSADCPPPLTDQRGVTRPQDGNMDGTAACDIGAFEVEIVPTAVTLSAFASPSGSPLPWLLVSGLLLAASAGIVAFRRRIVSVG